MKKLLFILSILAITSQAQDGFNFQGAAVDANGDELQNQSITIKTSVLSDSTSGAIQWQEIHSTTTDQFGLFNIVIGQGTSTGVGQTTDFDNMNWGSGNHYLRIEMDATGGSNYTLFGTSQLMSVPYALYAKSAGIDSTMLANMIGTSVDGTGGGCDFRFPEGLYGDPITVNLNIPYIVPNNKNLYILRNENNIQVDGKNVHQTADQGNPYIANSAQTISSLYPNTMLNGVLINKSNDVSIIFHDLLNNNYTVPNGKTFYVLGSTAPILIDGENIQVNGLPLILQAGKTVGSPNNTSSRIVNGYLVDEDYFANCGGGGNSSSATSVDSAMVAGMIANAVGMGGGCNFQFPEGLQGDPITHDLNNFNDYVVPSGKRLYIVQHYGGSSSGIRIDGNQIKVGGNSTDYGYTLANPIIASSGQIISNGNNALSVFNGVLVEESNDIQSITHDLNNFNDYVVPSGKRLYIVQHYGGSSSGIRIDGNQIKMGGNSTDYRYTLANPIIASSGQIISNGNNALSVFNGYLVDENYFANCGGGGSSSSSNNSVNVSTFGDTLTINGQSIIVPGISYLNVPTSNFGSATDLDGNTYQTIIINGKEWMTEDLLVSKYSNGTQIPIHSGSGGSNNSNYNSNCINPRYVYVSNSGGSNIPRAYYNGHALRAGNVCPANWHVASEQDYKEIFRLFGKVDTVPAHLVGNGYPYIFNDIGPALKSTSSSAGWSVNYSNTGIKGLANNVSKLSLENITSPSCVYLTQFNNSNNNAGTTHYYTSTPAPVNGGNYAVRITDGDDIVYFTDDNLENFYRVRCVKD